MPTPSSIASCITLTALISPAKASARPGVPQRRIDRHQNQRQILTASKAPRPGEIISE
jgi:hypothetical protein